MNATSRSKWVGDLTRSDDAVAAEMRGNNPSSEGLFLPKTASLIQWLAEKATQSLFPHACTEIRGHDFSRGEREFPFPVIPKNGGL